VATIRRLASLHAVRQDDGVNSVVNFAESYWWLIFIVPPVLGGALQRRHARRLAIIAAKGELEEKRQAALKPGGPQPVCGCSHHLSFHSPTTGGCAVEDCRCQQYVGPEPLGHVFAQPLIDPGTASST
jgi:hypothetical protein